ncbi:unnamed protein product [Caenorhabditis brenneri]
MTIPLLRLPLLASIEVIKNIDVKYIITLIQLSTRAKTLVKLSKVPIELTVFPSSIQFRELADQEMLETAFSYISLCFMEHAKSVGLKLATARVLIGGANPGVYRSLLKICSNASQLLVHFRTDEPFTFSGFNEYRTHKCRFAPKIRGYNWFTIDHMCALVNCSEVSVEGLNWSNEHYNRFLKFWMASDGNLKCWKLWTYRASIIPRVVMEGINKRELGHHTYEIQRVDGVKAEVLLSFSICTLKVIDA